MKIAYLINHQIWRNDGVTKKISVQVDTWIANGHEVEVFCITRKVGNSTLKARQYFLSNPIVGRLVVNNDLVCDIDEFKPEIIYLRYDLWSSTIARIIAKYKTIVELNTLDTEEYKILAFKEKTIKALFRYLAYIALRARLFRRLDGIVGVTHEIVASQSVARYALPSVVVPNGINLAKYSTLIRCEREPDAMRLFFIATPGQPWHGVDLIIDLARKIPDFEFHIVGIKSETDIKNVSWHGYLNQNEYIKILKSCHVCIGSLALFRNNMQEACPLKVREYLAYGFPIIIGYKDTAFIKGLLPDYVLELNLETGIITDDVVRSVRNFCMKIKNRIIYSDELEMINTYELENKRLNFLMNIAKDGVQNAAAPAA